MVKTFKTVVTIITLLAFAVTLAPGDALAQDVVCDSDVVVQADDWLSKIADKFYGDPLAYPAIASATNLIAASDDSYATISNYDIIEPGWKLCVPSAADAEVTLSEPIEDLTSFANLPAPEISALSLGFGLDPPFAPHIVAIEKGWFQDAGFESVDTQTFTAGALAGEALAAGEIQLWTPGNVPPISMKHNALPIVILGTGNLAYMEHLVVRADAGVEKPEDLYNIRIGLLEGSTASAVLGNVAAHYGLDPDKLQVVNLPPPEQFTSLIGNEVQGVVVWQPWVYLIQQELDVDLLNTGTISGFPQDEGERVQTSHTRSLYVMSEDFVQNNPNAARAIMQVMLRAQAYAANPANRAEVIKLFSDFQDQPIEQNEAIWHNYVFDPSFGESYVTDMQTYTDFLAQVGRISEPILDPMDYTYTDYVQEFRPNIVTVQGNWQPE